MVCRFGLGWFSSLVWVGFGSGVVGFALVWFSGSRLVQCFGLIGLVVMD